MNVLPVVMALAQYAPKLVKLLTGSDRAEDAAWDVARIAQQVSGAKSAADAVAAIQGDAAAREQFMRAVDERWAELEKTYLADVANARGRDIEVRRLSGGSNRRADIMVVAAAFGLIACLAVLAFFRKEIPGEAVGIISTVAGIFGACLKDAFAFEFGSSRGSKEKDQLLGRLADK